MSELTELDSLKQLADNKGVKYHPNISVEKLKEKIAAFDAGDSEPEKTTTKGALSKLQRREQQRKEQLKLVRCRITCMNPRKREWQGQWLSVGNNLIGFHTKYVLFDHEYHLPQVMVTQLQSAKFRMSKDIPDGKGGKTRKHHFPTEFNVELLEPLSKQELEDLAANQAKRDAID